MLGKLTGRNARNCREKWLRLERGARGPSLRRYAYSQINMLRRFNFNQASTFYEFVLAHDFLGLAIGKNPIILAHLRFARPLRKSSRSEFQIAL